MVMWRRRHQVRGDVRNTPIAASCAPISEITHVARYRRARDRAARAALRIPTAAPPIFLFYLIDGGGGRRPT